MNQSLAPAIWNVGPQVQRTGLLDYTLATFQAPDGTHDSFGAPGQGYVDVAGLVNIPCTAPPPSDARVQATEVRALAEIAGSEMHHVSIVGYYPTLDLGWRGEGTPPGPWRVLLGDNDGSGHLVNGFAYDIQGVEFDSMSQTTRVQVKLTTI